MNPYLARALKEQQEKRANQSPAGTKSTGKKAAEKSADTNPPSSKES